LHDVIRIAGEGNFGRPEARRTHVHRDLAVGFEFRHDQSALRLDADLALVGEALLMDEAHEAARAVAALLDLAAVGVEDAVAEIDARRRAALDDQDLVAADAEMAVGEKARLGRRRHEVLADRVEHDEIVAEAMHFGKTNTHRARIRRVAGADFPELGSINPLFPGGRVLKRLCSQ
jgi:hypothetical protein